MGLLDGALGDALGSVMGGAAKPGEGGNLQGMLGGLLGQLGGGKGQSGALLATVMTLVQQNGGIEGIIAKFRASGMGDAVDSWVGTGANAPVTGDQVSKVLGESTVSDIAGQMGTDSAQASGSLASMLPELINQFTPNGKVPANSGDLLSQAMAMLK